MTKEEMTHLIIIVGFGLAILIFYVIVYLKLEFYEFIFNIRSYNIFIVFYFDKSYYCIYAFYIFLRSCYNICYFNYFICFVFYVNDFYNYSPFILYFIISNFKLFYV